MAGGNEADCAEVLLLRAIETTPHPGWSAEDAAWASRVAREEVGDEAEDSAFLLARARAAWQRLGPHEPALARWRRWAHPRHGAVLAGLAAVALLFGLLADPVGRTQRIDLLAPPVWAVVAWNLAVYAALALGMLFHGGRPGRLRRAVARWRQRGPGAAGGSFGRFAADWWPRTAPLNAARITLALHLAAALLALGLVGGLYLRGLVLDYRVGWQSTFLGAPTVHALLSVALAPALALSGQTLPDAAGIAALRDPGADIAAASAAPWIHLLALTLGLWVIAPRLLLAGLSAAQARRRRRALTLPLDEPYFRRLLAGRRAQPLRLRLVPYAHAPGADAVDALRMMLTEPFGTSAVLHVEPMVAFGGEDGFAPPPTDGARSIALFDLGATPEEENQGRFVARLAAAGPVGVWVDEAGFRARFGEQSARLPARREAWAALAAAHGATVAFIDTRHPDARAVEAALAALAG